MCCQEIRPQYAGRMVRAGLGAAALFCVGLQGRSMPLQEPAVSTRAGREPRYKVVDLRGDADAFGMSSDTRFVAGAFSAFQDFAYAGLWTDGKFQQISRTE